MANTDDVGNIQPNLSTGARQAGRCSRSTAPTIALRRKLLTPPFHGKSIKNYEKIFEEETLRESANWPEGQAFSTLEPMMRITLNAILRAVFGADGEQLDELRRIIPPWVTLGSRLGVLPKPTRTFGRYSPWGQARRIPASVRRRHRQADRPRQGRPELRQSRRRPRAAPAQHLRGRFGDVAQDIGDELLTLLAAGHETTASTLGWAFERITRHPAVLSTLVEEAATDDNEYRQATILEVQRARTVIDFAGRHVYAPTFELGEWVIPQGLFDRGRDIADARPRRGLSRSGAVRSAALHRYSAADIRLHSIRRRHPALRRRGVRQRRDGRRATNGVAALRDRHDHSAR